MRRLTILGLLLTLAGIVGAAQLNSAQSPDQSPTRKPSQPAAPRSERERQAPEPKSAQKSSDNKAPAQDIRAGTRVQATLESGLDAGTAQPGDEVRARVTKNVKQDGQVVIHKGDELLGHVTSVQAAGSGQGASQLAVSFDQLLQGEASSQLSTVVTAVLSTPSEERARREEMASEPMPAPSAAGGSRPARQSSGSPGLVGNVTSTVGSTVNAAGSTVGGAVGATSRSTLGGTAAAGLSTPRRALHVESAARAEHATGVNSVFSTRDGQLRLESGTRLQLRVVGETASSSANPSHK